MLPGTPLTVWAGAAAIASWSQPSQRDGGLPLLTTRTHQHIENLTMIDSRYGKGVGAAHSGAVPVR